MNASIVSGSIKPQTKTIANAAIRKQGLTPNEVIRRLWEYIARHGELPEELQETPQATDEKRAAFERMNAIIETLPTGTDLDWMDDEMMRKEMQDRDL